MAMAVLGGLASKLLPQAIGWGVKKLSKSNIGRGIGSTFQGLMKAANSKPAKMIIEAVQQNLPKMQKTKKIRKCDKRKKMIQKPEQQQQPNEQNQDNQQFDYDLDKMYNQ